MLQARLELAPRVNPDWILSPTRLPIPPLERGILSCHAQEAESVYFYTSRKINLDSTPSISTCHRQLINGVLATGA